METVLIRNMVCHHCEAAVRQCFDNAGIAVADVRLGAARVEKDDLTPERLAVLDRELLNEGFERIVDAEDGLVEKAKLAVIHHVRREDECRLNLSACIERHIGVPYDTIARAFSAKEGRTIEKYHIAQRVEWVKELLGYKELTLSEIAYRTGYSSPAHLSRQFKAVTGMTPSQYLQLPPTRKGLNEV